MSTGPNPLDDKYAPGAEQARQNVMVAVSVGMTVIGVTCVLLRVFTRACIVRNMGREDWTMVAAATTTIVLTLELIVGAKQFKLGFSGLHLTPAEMVSNVQLILAVIVTYKMTVTLIKLSILMMYLRLSISKTFEWLCLTTMGLLVAYQVIVIIVVPAQCTPLKKLWDFTGEVEGHCINANAFYHVTSAFHIFMDLWILILPIKLMLRIPRPSREKLAIIIIFSLGVISTLASIIRLQSLRIFTLSTDPFYDSLPINTWSMVEVNIGILCASIPTLKPLVSRSQRQRIRLTSGDEISEWSGDRKSPVLQTGKDMLISLQVATRMSRAEWELDDRPPAPPPKDQRVDARRQAAEYRAVIRHPESVFFKP